MRVFRKAICFTTLVFLTSATQAATFKIVHTFAGSDGQSPQASLSIDKKGNLYGTTYDGGSFDDGTIFEISSSGGFSLIHSFSGSGGEFPEANVLLDKKGNIFGTTSSGGSLSAGTVFETTSDGAETVLHSFQLGTDGAFPVAGVISDKKKNLYGTTTFGGTANGGLVFKLDKTGTITALHLFSGVDKSSGESPNSGLVADKAGDHFGTTTFGGTSGCGGSGCGVVYEINAKGAFKDLYLFNGGTDGGAPYSSLAMDKHGNLFGTTSTGGSHGQGTVFEITSQGKETVLYSFKAGSDGANPHAGVVLDKKGNLFGVTEAGGGNNCNGLGCGVVFEVSPSGTEQVLYAFTGEQDGSDPIGGVILDKKGNIFGTTSLAGAKNCGVVFEISP
jgi:uncharacterized repeat protein (TIGR03803 family)